MARKSSELSPEVALYLKRREELLDEAKGYVQANSVEQRDSTHGMAAAVNHAIKCFGYSGNSSSSTFGARELSVHERDEQLPTESQAAYLALAFAMYGEEPWAKEPLACLRQVYSYFIWGTHEPRQDERHKRFEQLTRRFPLPRALVKQTETEEQIADVVERILPATPYALAAFLRAIADAVEARAQQIRTVEGGEDDSDADDDAPETVEPSCNEHCVFVDYLVLTEKMNRPITDEHRQMVAEATGIPLNRMARLMCGDPWTEEESAMVEAWVSHNYYTLKDLKDLKDLKKLNQ